MAGWFFEAPGGLTDFPDSRDWHEAMAREAGDIIKILVASTLGKDTDQVTDGDIAQVRPTLAYADPTETPPPADAQTITVQPWNGFPRAVRRRSPWAQFPAEEGDEEGNYRAVEHSGSEDGVFVNQQNQVLNLPVRDRQDEYLEWAARRNSAGQIVKIIFVAEGYDYFAELYRRDERRVVDLYRDFTEVSSITADDLRAGETILRRYGNQFGLVARQGEFNPRNRHNLQPGIVHLSHAANSLGAEVNLAGVSGIARRRASGAVLDGANPEELLCCNAGGNPNRNSDPLISAQAYAQVRDGYNYTLANPVGLYIAAIEEAGLLLPDNQTQVPREWWRAVRGEGLWDPANSRVLRLELEVPASEGLTISDLLVGGSPVRYPGQISDLLSVHLFVTRWKRTDGTIGPEVPCDATCCRQQGGVQLAFWNGGCPQGFQLAFPDLLPAPPPSLLAEMAATSGTTDRALTRRSAAATEGRLRR